MKNLEINRIYNQDCINGMNSIPDKSIDMILCDLPYGTTKCKWDSIIPFTELWEGYNRVIKDNGAIVLTASDPFTAHLTLSNPSMYRYKWVWVKTNCTGFANVNKQPLRTLEDVLVFYKKQPTYNPQGVKRLDKPINKGKRSHEFMGKSGFKDGYKQEFTNYPKNLINVPSERGFHPTQKPVALFEYLIKTYTNEGKTVLDTCMGSGTTAIAAINTNRNFIGFELDEGYYDKSIERINSLTPSLFTTMPANPVPANDEQAEGVRNV